MESLKYIKVGFMFYIGFEIAKTLDNKYRTKIINVFNNLSD